MNRFIVVSFLLLIAVASSAHQTFPFDFSEADKTSPSYAPRILALAYKVAAGDIDAVKNFFATAETGLIKEALLARFTGEFSAKIAGSYRLEDIAKAYGRGDILRLVDDARSSHLKSLASSSDYFQGWYCSNDDEREEMLPIFHASSSVTRERRRLQMCHFVWGLLGGQVYQRSPNPLLEKLHEACARADVQQVKMQLDRLSAHDLSELAIEMYETEIPGYRKKYISLLVSAVLTGSADVVREVARVGLERQMGILGHLPLAIRVAAIYGNVGVVRVLLDALQASHDFPFILAEAHATQGERGNGVLHAALQGGLKTLQLILDTAIEQPKWRAGITEHSALISPLEQAVMDLKFREVRAFLNAADQNLDLAQQIFRMGGAKISAFERAVQSGDLEMLRTLLASPAFRSWAHRRIDVDRIDGPQAPQVRAIVFEYFPDLLERRIGDYLPLFARALVAVYVQAMSY